MMKSKFLLISISIHLLLLLCLTQITFLIRPEKKPVTFIKAFIQADLTSKAKLPTHELVIKKSGLIHRAAITQPDKPKLQHYSGISQTNIPTDEILKVLHSYIAAHQTYPPEALELNQSGRARVRFTLTPNGELTHILLAQTSGYTSLDDAALAAIKAASPIPAAGHYLQKNSTFSIDIVFA